MAGAGGADISIKEKRLEIWLELRIDQASHLFLLL